ncbi:MAG: ribosome small subunit-dependent GTPase A [Planctomycetaceae bacterium]|jgi:ribosome biogenesis GTPase|nr:ribosome small subunit-dependent GTPase A [Planctomycetaceae bacterium]
MKKTQKVRVEFRRNRNERTRDSDLTRQFQEHGFEEEKETQAERIGGKGDMSRRRTVVGELLRGDSEQRDGFEVVPKVDADAVISGRVIRVHGASSEVRADDGRIFSCVTRRILKTLSTKERQPVVAGDRVLFRAANNCNDNSTNNHNYSQAAPATAYIEGMIERVEPRHGIISRESKHRKHVIVTNVDQVLIIASATQPAFKPNLIDRMLIMSEKAGIKPIICINKVDLIELFELQPLVGVYAQMGYEVILSSVVSGLGIDRLRGKLRGCESVIVGQSGVGKSSLLNAIDSCLKLRVSELGAEQKGKHTTTTAELLELSSGGYVVDTPGIRQFMLWDIIPEEVLGFFRDLRPYENFCHYPDCVHLHEEDCAIKNAVAEGRLDMRRYESYLAIRFEERYSR